MATAAKVAAAEAQNAAYREAKIRETDSVANVEAAWMLTQVQLTLDVDLDRCELDGAALLTVAPASGAAPEALAELVLDVPNLDVHAVSLPSEGLDALPFTVHEGSESGLRIELPPPSPGWGWSTLVLKVDYRARDGSGLCWVEGDGISQSGPLFFMGHGTACGFPCTGVSTVGVTHSAVVTVSVGSTAVAKELKAIMYTTHTTAQSDEIVRHGVGQNDNFTRNAVTALSTEEMVAAEPELELEPEQGQEPDQPEQQQEQQQQQQSKPAADVVQRVFELRVSEPVPCSALHLAVGCLDRVTLRSDGSGTCDCKAPWHWCCCRSEPCTVDVA